MQIISAYKCEYCGKVYQRGDRCLRHESTCAKGPDNRPLCYSCKHCCKDNLIYRCNKVEAPNNKLYIRDHLPKDWCVRIEKYHGYRTMPTPTNGGCEYYERQ